MYRHHDTRFAGHKGPKATTVIFQCKYYWPGMTKMIEDYIQGCDLCQRSKSRTHAPYGPLAPLHTPDRKWTHISYDFITKLPLSNRMDTIMVIVDRFSKGVHRVMYVLVLAPLFAMLKTPLSVCFSAPLRSYSSQKGVPQYDSPPRPVPVGSPPCICDRKSE